MSEIGRAIQEWWENNRTPEQRAQAERIEEMMRRDSGLTYMAWDPVDPDGEPQVIATVTLPPGRVAPAISTGDGGRTWVLYGRTMPQDMPNVEGDYGEQEARREWDPARPRPRDWHLVIWRMWHSVPGEQRSNAQRARAVRWCPGWKVMMECNQRACA